MDTSARVSELEARRARLSEGARAALDARLREAARERVRPAGTSCLVPLGDGVGEPLFCVHPAGGDVLAYAALARRMRRPTFGLQSPGLMGDGAPLDTIEALAARYADAITAAAPRGPILLAGWSLGAHVVLELGHALLARGRRPALLAVIDADPAVPGPDALPAPGDAAPWLRAVAEFVERTGGAELGLDVDALAALPEAVRLERFAEGLRQARVPGGATAERLGRLLAVFEANTRALARYRPRPLAAPLTVLATADTAAVAAGWAALVERVEILPLDGDHYSLVTEPAVATLAERLEAAAAAALVQP